MLTGSLPPVSRRSTYIETLELIDDASGDPIDLTGAAITVSIYDSAVVSDYGDVRSWPAALTATLGNGVTVPETGIVQWRFEAGSLACLRRDATLSVIISRDGDTDEIARLSLPIED